jgi:hypothetical protein
VVAKRRGIFDLFKEEPRPFGPLTDIFLSLSLVRSAELHKDGFEMF